MAGSFVFPITILTGRTAWNRWETHCSQSKRKIAYCEKVYADFHTPTNFKINPLLAPSFDALLERRGYQVRHVTEVMTLSEEAFSSFDESPEDSPGTA